MYLCANGHEEVCYEDTYCPACTALEESGRAFNEIETLSENLEEIQDRYYELQDTYKELAELVSKTHPEYLI